MSRLILLIIAINFCFTINSSLASEDDCVELRFIPNPDQKEIQGEILRQRTWRSSVYNLFRLTHSGSPLKKGAISTNLCKCVLTKMNHNRNRYENFPHVSSEEDRIDAKLQENPIYGIDVIKCTNSGTEHEHLILKSNIAGALFTKAYDMYVLHAGTGQFQYVCDGVLKEAPIDAFKPDQTIQMQSL